MDSATQDFLEIKDIREGVLVLKNNGLRGILMVSSLNFALKSSEEQSSIIYAYQSFLNSLDFSCQIVIQSRNVNITPYLDTVKNLAEKQTNELLKVQTSSYADFIKELVQGDNIMTKSFYVVVPYTLTEALGAGAALNKSGLFDIFKKNKNKNQQLGDEDFEKCKNQLWQRMEFLAMGLKRCGLDVMPLTTPELIELFWAMHHPDQAEVGYYPEILPELLK
ncbi:MAG: hypothetical protein A3C50_00385 [Candidatus Staskawiczbacteria bacterium RIFCSPHIGHO2_02_FULL_43_16]|uniref:TraC-like domain-containing protein n=1 Tax=Candidatus Staskawiczbacteria bacterium RIFCSPHIGHO2_01_FULL_41_41 TaxID=1802203 RepID=A0A1G2HVK5_9BACT|nr:MAG: hypothetical protein A2822_02050 [Candidatus Staskawiczbacteria bacterium RIFCSPHIGHO2_01_FULL_41_41]OGZ68942.1 MAG: hypothetical protein A3C50_00385 [Candidatus Staskawiczbacteria bacterium RIFCSPHIGHO2_02_FULL_43_16]OGZ74876.1 MAG: hypothetical protein A3A12_03430 [Candidatus Staskawiczbacteria bacterium RIFCSPLOWO2_01_FULL_43_17b]